MRRCLGAAFALTEMQSVLEALVHRSTLLPDRPAPEKVGRRSITLGPARGGRIVRTPLPA